jgi:putative peptidoglycan lipid II flippase
MTIGGLSILAKLVVMVKDLLVARHFGTSSELDAYLIAFLAPSFTISVVGGSFSSAFIPVYIDVREREGRRAAQALFSSISLWSLAILAGTSVLLGIGGPLILRILGSGFSPSTLAMSRSFFIALLPVVVLSGLGFIWGSVLNADHKYALFAISPAVPPSAVIAALLLFGYQLGAYALVYGLLVGFVLQGGLLAIGLACNGFRVIPGWHGHSSAVRQVLRQYAPMLVGAFIMGSTELVDQAIGTTLGPGTVAALSYGNKITAFVVGIGGLGLGTAVLPHFSQMVSNHDWKGVRHTLKTYLKLVLLVSVPVTMFLVAFSRPIVRLIYERGAFEAADTLLVSRIQALYSLQIPFFLMGILFVRLISSLRANHMLMWGALINLTVNIALDILLGRWLGAAGIALATAVVYLISFCYLGFVLARFLGRADRIPNAHG